MPPASSPASGSTMSAASPNGDAGAFVTATTRPAPRWRAAIDRLGRRPARRDDDDELIRGGRRLRRGGAAPPPRRSRGGVGESKPPAPRSRNCPCRRRERAARGRRRGRRAGFPCPRRRRPSSAPRDSGSVRTSARNASLGRLTRRPHARAAARPRQQRSAALRQERLGVGELVRGFLASSARGEGGRALARLWWLTQAGSPRRPEGTRPGTQPPNAASSPFRAAPAGPRARGRSSASGDVAKRRVEPAAPPEAGRLSLEVDHAVADRRAGSARRGSRRRWSRHPVGPLEAGELLAETVRGRAAP